MSWRRKIVPAIVACPLFLQNTDLMALTVALPTIARDLDVPALHLNAVIAAYAISLAAFLPLSAWLAERFGPRPVFCAAIVLFAASSALCGAATSAQFLVACRVLQGLAAAMMVPVGRLILIRSVPASDLVVAMVWFTIPGAVGRLLGPLVGGTLVTFLSWRWIFLINIPVGLLALVLTIWLVHPPEAEHDAPRFDLAGFVMMALGLGLLLGGLDTIGKGIIHDAWAGAIIAAGLVVLAAYVFRSLRIPEPVIDLSILRFRAYRANVIGAFPLRLANTSVPFLLPLLFQLSFGLSPLTTGAIAAASAVGSISTRAIMRRAMARYSFRTLIVAATGLTVLVFGSYALFTPAWPHFLIVLAVYLGGVVSSVTLVCLNSLGFVEVPAPRTSHATALLTMAQQVCSALGVVFAASVLTLSALAYGRDGAHLLRADFAAAFIAIALLAAISLLQFTRLKPEEDGGL